MKLMLSYPSSFFLSTMFCSALPSELVGKCFNKHLEMRRDACKNSPSCVEQEE